MIASVPSTVLAPLPASTSLKETLGISDEVLDHAFGVAYQLYRAGHLAAAASMCRALIACDPQYWWSRSLHASILRRQGRWQEALSEVEEGLRHEPAQPKLLLLRSELLVTIARNRHARGSAAASDIRLPASVEGRL